MRARAVAYHLGGWGSPILAYCFLGWPEVEGPVATGGYLVVLVAVEVAAYPPFPPGI